jgi:predicted amidohydrolase YtcJ
MIDAGIVCAGGSDAPIETSNPFQGTMQIYMTRVSIDWKQRVKLYVPDLFFFTRATQLYVVPSRT